MKRDKEAFLKVLDQHKLIIFKVCNNYCQEVEDQKDLVQEVILQLWKSFHKYDEQYKLSTWIYRIALNVAISNYRKSSTRKKYMSPINGDILLLAHNNDDEKSDKTSQLQRYIGQLNTLDRALIILYLDGQSHIEMAEILCISKSNVGTKINRIKQKLKHQFKTTTKWN